MKGYGDRASRPSVRAPRTHRSHALIIPDSIFKLPMRQGWHFV
jgi:hypothetical protein